MRESTIETNVSAFAKRLGWLHYKWKSPGNRGVTDRLYLRNMVIIFIEFKAPKKKPTKLQAKVHQKIMHEGFPVYVVDNIADGKAIFRNEEDDDL